MTDSDGESDSATSKISVEEEKDYPPTANAGEHRLFNSISKQFSSQITVGKIFFFAFFPELLHFLYLTLFIQARTSSSTFR